MPFDDEDLELAFQLHVVDLLAESDLVTTGSEAALIERWFPRETLRVRGFVDEAGARTDRFRQAVTEASAVLRTRLVLGRKIELLDTCYRIAVCDREFRLGEGTVLLMAARLLGLSDLDFDAFIAARPGAPGMTAALLDRD